MKKRSLYDILFIFLVCGVLGWIFETLVVYFTQGIMTDRGYLFVMGRLPEYLPFLKGVPLLKDLHLVWGLPLIEMYGIGAVLISLFFDRYKKQPAKLFFTSMFGMTLFELLSSYLSSWLLHKTYWDYSKDFLNFQGRICLRSSIAWGVLSLAMIYFIDPFLDFIYGDFKKERNYKRIIVVLTVYAIICALTKYWWDPTIIKN
ncbi:putative ABC transporter permease [Enterococcus sp. HY326]|uniref:putative ABC transporter permease n=1 Tax=Enterococcus sp. HY326 TaxID=2971265 RepID=UPI00223EA0E2|nr:putative ABC transporter permease [Enterococcus sp. HY326]